jgi:integrase
LHRSFGIAAGLVSVAVGMATPKELAPLKSKASRRTVPVGQVVIDALAAHLADYPSDGALFVDERGAPLTYRRWRQLWKEAANAEGVDATSHDLRHFCASALISGGASVKQVQTVLGHASAVITLRTYSHMWPGDEDRTRSIMDAALSPLADSVRTEGVTM